MKHNKEELVKQANKLQKELDQLKLLIKNSDTIDLFSITTYKEVCKALGKKEVTLSDFSFLPTDQQEKAISYCQIQDIKKLFNGDWKENWNNSNQYKYYPYFWSDRDSWHFDDVYYDFSHSAGLAAHFKDRKTAEHVGKTFIDIYKKIL